MPFFLYICRIGAPYMPDRCAVWYHRYLSVFVRTYGIYPVRVYVRTIVLLFSPKSAICMFVRWYCCYPRFVIGLFELGCRLNTGTCPCVLVLLDRTIRYLLIIAFRLIKIHTVMRRVCSVSTGTCPCVLVLLDRTIGYLLIIAFRLIRIHTVLRRLWNVCSYWYLSLRSRLTRSYQGVLADHCVSTYSDPYGTAISPIRLDQHSLFDLISNFVCCYAILYCI